MNVVSSLRKRLARRMSRVSTVPRHIEPNDVQLITELKRQSTHDVREFYHGLRKYSVDCLYCHAVPGTLETSLTLLAGFTGKGRSNRLLNLGGGTGQVTQILGQLGFEVINIDKELEVTSETSIKFDLNVPGRLPVSEASFDFVLCQEVIEHVENPWDLFRKIRLALKSGGSLVLTTPNVQSRFSKKIFVDIGYFHWFTPDCLSYHINPLPLWEIELISGCTGFDLLRILGNGDYYFGSDATLARESILSNNEALVFAFQAR